MGDSREGEDEMIPYLMASGRTVVSSSYRE